MRLKKHTVMVFGLIMILNISCYQEEEPENGGRVMGYKPVYASYETIAKVSFMDGRPMKSPGKIYVMGSYLFVVEQNSGIHVINNQDQRNPKPEKFINIPGIVDLAVKNRVLYADNGPDLVAIDISNPSDLKILKRLEKVLPYPEYPPYENVKFECVDPAKGYVIGWDYVELDNPKCFR